MLISVFLLFAMFLNICLKDVELQDMLLLKLLIPHQKITTNSVLKLTYFQLVLSSTYCSLAKVLSKEKASKKYWIKTKNVKSILICQDSANIQLLWIYCKRCWEKNLKIDWTPNNVWIMNFSLMFLKIPKKLLILILLILKNWNKMLKMDLIKIITPSCKETMLLMVTLIQ